MYFLWLVFEDGKGGHPQNIFNSSQNSQSFPFAAWCVKPKWWGCLIIFVQILYFVFLVSRVWYINCYFQIKEESELSWSGYWNKRLLKFLLLFWYSKKSVWYSKSLFHIGTWYKGSLTRYLADDLKVCLSAWFLIMMLTCSSQIHKPIRLWIRTLNLTEERWEKFENDGVLISLFVQDLI